MAAVGYTSTPSGGGSGGTSSSYAYQQVTPATVWGPIAHNFGYRPAGVQLFSADFSQQYDEFTVQHLDENHLRIAMDVATAGVLLIAR